MSVPRPPFTGWLVGGPKYDEVRETNFAGELMLRCPPHQLLTPRFISAADEALFYSPWPRVDEPGHVGEGGEDHGATC